MGVEELFISVGNKYIDPNYKDDGNKKPNAEVIEESIKPPPIEQNQTKKKEIEDENPRTQSIKLNREKIKEKKKKKCC